MLRLVILDIFLGYILIFTQIPPKEHVSENIPWHHSEDSKHLGSSSYYLHGFFTSQVVQDFFHQQYQITLVTLGRLMMQFQKIDTPKSD